MKKSIKILILGMLLISSGVFGFCTSILKGLILMGVSVLGVFILEKREVARMVVYFDPLLFRCGRTLYVEESLRLLENELLFKFYFEKRLLYLFAGVYNVRGGYNKSIETIKMFYTDINKCRDKKVSIEWQYALLKQGDPLILKNQGTSYREKLCYTLYLMGAGKVLEARELLHELRGEETGNVIFREVNFLLSQLYKGINEQEAQYYEEIANRFYDNE